MNKVDELALLLNQKLKDSNEYKNYQNSLNNLRKNESLYHLEKELKQLQKLIVEEKKKEDNQSYELMMEYKKKQTYFQEHPVVVNYIEDKENFTLLCEYIKDLIEGSLKD